MSQPERTPPRLAADSKLTDEQFDAAIAEGLRLALQGAQRNLAVKMRRLADKTIRVAKT